MAERVVWEEFRRRYPEFVGVLVFYGRSRLGVDVAEAFARDLALFKRTMVAVFGEHAWLLFREALFEVVSELYKEGRLERKEADRVLEGIMALA